RLERHEAGSQGKISGQFACERELDTAVTHIADDPESPRTIETRDRFRDLEQRTDHGHVGSDSPLEAQFDLLGLDDGQHFVTIDSIAGCHTLFFQSAHVARVDEPGIVERHDHCRIIEPRHLLRTGRCFRGSHDLAIARALHAGSEPGAIRSAQLQPDGRRRLFDVRISIRRDSLQARTSTVAGPTKVYGPKIESLTSCGQGIRLPMAYRAVDAMRATPRCEVSRDGKLT